MERVFRNGMRLYGRKRLSVNTITQTDRQRLNCRRKEDNMTRELLERIKKDNVNIFLNIESLKGWYIKNTVKREVVLAEIRGYLTALVQLGYITETEKRLLHCYITL